MDLPDIQSLIIIVLAMFNLALFVHNDALSSGLKEDSAILWSTAVFATSLAGVLV